ncbi:azurin [Paucimonas lemoignei]|uniref:Azurin n=1 Tax=Paucimonas lemoignei TaxID=29443 RepID=A0A4V2UJF7_PAULE|nr:azurin [Paucimonas lemoignei]TCS39510.1 azurin [Paucimonas lemoignei]
MKTGKIAVLLLFSGLAGPVLAAQCNVEIEGNDAMQFNKKSIDVPQSCKKFTVTLKHTGKLPKASMGHNWVATKTADMQGVVNDGTTAGLDKDYVKPGDNRVIAHTKVVGGGESDSVSFDASKLKPDGDYTFFCSFPGHSTVMKGKLTVVKS